MISWKAYCVVIGALALYSLEFVKEKRVVWKLKGRRNRQYINQVTTPQGRSSPDQDPRGF
jgi:hypothetical protein